MNSPYKECSLCKKTFLISTHFQSIAKPETTKTCKICRDLEIKRQNKPTSIVPKRRSIYLTHKRNKIEKNRGCEWPNGCRFNFSAQPESFAVCDEVENIVIFDFDHLQEKLFQVSNWVTRSKKYNEQDLIDEISKCRIICSFHHRIHSQNQRTEKSNNKFDYSDSINAMKHRKIRRGKYDKLNELKLDPKKFGKCEICERPVLEGESSGFDFDHKNFNEKHRAISKLVISECSWENIILPEIDKCQLICTNCHRIHTEKQRVQSKNENVAIVCRKRKRYRVPQNKEELETRDKGERPTKEELHALVLKYSFINVGKMYQVRDVTIIMWCKKAGIPHTRRKLMEILDET